MRHVEHLEDNVELSRREGSRLGLIELSRDRWLGRHRRVRLELRLDVEATRHVTLTARTRAHLRLGLRIRPIGDDDRGETMIWEEVDGHRVSADDAPGASVLLQHGDLFARVRALMALGHRVVCEDGGASIEIAVGAANPMSARDLSALLPDAAERLAALVEAIEAAQIAGGDRSSFRAPGLARLGLAPTLWPFGVRGEIEGFRVDVGFAAPPAFTLARDRAEFHEVEVVYPSLLRAGLHLRTRDSLLASLLARAGAVADSAFTNAFEAHASSVELVRRIFDEPLRNDLLSLLVEPCVEAARALYERMQPRRSMGGYR